MLRSIAVGAAHDIGDHLLLTARAIALWYAVFWLAMWVTLFLYRSVGLTVWNWTVDHDFDTLRVFVTVRGAVQIDSIGVPWSTCRSPSDSGAKTPKSA